MSGLETQIIATTPSGVASAADILTNGGLVAFPTETVYGLGADARNDSAVANVYAAKGRPNFNPLIVHCANLSTAQKYADFNDTALRLASAFWPGPLSMVLPLKSGHGLSDLVTAGLDTVAIRVPEHPVAQQLLARFDGPLAAPSANPSGKISPTNADHVIEDMSGLIHAVLDGGPCEVGLESTILRVDKSTVSLLRAGGLPVAAIEACLGYSVALPQDPITPQSPGQLQSHYAPNAPLLMNVVKPSENQVLLGFGPACPDAAVNLSEAGDLSDAAANLFSHLRKIDKLANGKTIAVSPIPFIGLGIAINDRLKRAAAPRD